VTGVQTCALPIYPRGDASGCSGAGILMMDTANQYVHEAVLLREVLELLPTEPNGVYVDGTFGRGGHTRALLGQLGPKARVFGIDRDPQAVAVGKVLEQEDPRFHMVASRFDCLPEIVVAAGEKLAG